MTDTDDLIVTRLASVRLALTFGERRRRLDTRTAGFAAKYAPILSKLSDTEWLGLVSAVGVEIERRGPVERVAARAMLEQPTADSGG